MSPDVLDAANGPWLWGAAVLMVSVVLLQALLYVRQSLAAARRIGFPRARCYQAFRAGAVSAIGPSLAVAAIMLGMMTVVGAPATWFKLSIIGAAPTSLAAVQFGADACGVKVGSPEYDLNALACSCWAMNISCVGWLLVVVIFARRLESLRRKVSGGDSQWLAVLSGAAMLGAFAALISKNLNPRDGFGGTVAMIVGGVSMVALLKLSDRVTWLGKEYALGLAMLLGMAAAMMI